MTKRLCTSLIIVILMSLISVAQSRRVIGTVTDETGAALPRASVILKSQRQTGTTTGDDGRFTISAGPGAIVIVSAVGFETKEFNIENKLNFEVHMLHNNNSLNEVVVTALGIKREKRQLTYSTQEVKGEVLQSTKETSVLNALTGRVSGVQITSSTGQPGSSSRIVIRGLSSLTSNNQALIILDGVPINNSENGNAGAGAGSSRLSDIDPSTIESVNVLKGSAASALYGSAAARGVLLITTKNGSADRKAQLSFTTQLSIETPILPEIQEKYALGDRGIYYDGETIKSSTVWGPRIDTLLVGGKPVYNRNPMKDFFQKGLTYTNTLSVGGGTGRSNYLLSYSYLDQKGTIPTSALKKHNLFAKFTSAISDKFTTTIQMNYISSLTDKVNEGYDLTSPLWTIYTAPLTYNLKPYLDSAGNQRLFRASRNNPYWVLDNIHNTSRINRFIPIATLIYTPLSWLSITERIGADIYGQQNKYVEAPSNLLATTGSIIDQSDNFRQYNHDLIVEARKKIGDNWNLSLLVGNNILSVYSQRNSVSGVGLTIPGFDNVSNASTITAGETHSLRRKVGYYAQSNVEYKRVLNLSLTGRYDGTSVLAKGNNYYPYGSASAGFIFSELIKVPALNMGKLRASYSKVGNDDGIGAYDLNTPFTRPTGFPYNGRAGFLLSAGLGNTTLKNESTKEFEAGLEMMFLKNRLGVEASYYDRKHYDLLTSVSISAGTGFTSTILNAGDMTNKGVELLLKGSPVRTNNFSWDVTVNYTKNKNKVIRIYQDQPSLSIGQTQVFVGNPYGDFFNTGYVYNADGKIMIDAAGLPVVSTNRIIGNIQPDWLGGITNTFRYKSFSLNFFFDMRKGGDILNSDDRYGYFYGTPKVTENREARVVPGISVVDNKENTKLVQAEDYYQRLNLIYESIIQDGTYIKLRNVNINYNLPKKWLGKLPFSAASLTATGRNLWIYAPHFTGADPEVSSYGSANGSQGVYADSAPTSRSYNFTLSVTFK